MKKVVVAFLACLFLTFAAPASAQFGDGGGFGDGGFGGGGFGADDGGFGGGGLDGPGGELPVDDGGFGGGMGASTEEIQAQMEAEAEEQRKKLRREAFEAAMRGLLPLKPEEIDEMLDRFVVSRRHAEAPLNDPGSLLEIETVSLDPGSTPPTIRLSPGHITTLTLLDMTGSPWPIQDVGWAGAFKVDTPEAGGHVIRITPETAHGIGNMSMRLVGLITPITFKMVTALEEAHYRLDIRVPKMGPLAKAPLISHGGLNTVAGDDVLINVLDGTPPPDSERLVVEGVDGRTSAYRFAGTVYLRTPLTLLSPAWSGSATSADGMSVYALNDAPVVLLSDNGRMVRAHIGSEEVSQ